MFLFLIEADVSSKDSEYYDSAVVAAESEDVARLIHPRMDTETGAVPTYGKDEWADTPDSVTVTLIGTARPGTKMSVVLAKWNC